MDWILSSTTFMMQTFIMYPLVVVQIRWYLTEISLVVENNPSSVMALGFHKIGIPLVSLFGLRTTLLHTAPQYLVIFLNN